LPQSHSPPFILVVLSLSHFFLFCADALHVVAWLISGCYLFTGLLAYLFVKLAGCWYGPDTLVPIGTSDAGDELAPFDIHG
jgi:hypothetical protein